MKISTKKTIYTFKNKEKKRKTKLNTSVVGKKKKKVRIYMNPLFPQPANTTPHQFLPPSSSKKKIQARYFPNRRKVKCDGLNPCRNCNASQLTCTYNAIPQKKGPKGSRAKVISELRETQRQTTFLARLHGQLTQRNPPVLPPPGCRPIAGYIPADLVKECVGFFFERCYGYLPLSV